MDLLEVLSLFGSEFGFLFAFGFVVSFEKLIHTENEGHKKILYIVAAFCLWTLAMA